MSSLKSLKIELFFKIIKLLKLCLYPSLFPFLFKGIVPSFEHERILKFIGKQGSLVDCGSNKGQFALLSFKINKFSQYVGFDPILYPTFLISYLKKRKVKVFFNKMALSNCQGVKNFFITKRDDSSSLKKPKEIASEYFQDVYTVNQRVVKVSKLSSFIDLINYLKEPRLLKIDVQGNEYELLKGSESVLNLFKYIIIECTYLDLYEDVKFKIEDINDFLVQNNYTLAKEYNKVVRRNELISSDRLYIKRPMY